MAGLLFVSVQTGKCCNILIPAAGVSILTRGVRRSLIPASEWATVLVSAVFLLITQGHREAFAESAGQGQRLVIQPWQRQQPFCSSSAGSGHHREALALSWHRPDPGPQSSNR
ncbi:unnamed protein product [Boreogadus saida]